MPPPSRRAVLFSAAGTTLAAFAKIAGIELGVCGNPDAFLKADHWGFE
jgi:hypothetical protein